MALCIDISKMGTPPTTGYCHKLGCAPNYYNINYSIAIDYSRFILFIIVLKNYNINNNPVYVLIYGKRLRKNKTPVSYTSIFSMFYTYWIASMCLVLIVISNPSILNPGPDQIKCNNNISILYHNCRGLRSTSKNLDFNSHVFKNKPDIIILNETWFCKDIKDNEILPSEFYKIFRLDRSRKSHPIDINDPNKYKEKGGGVLIAVKTDLDVQSRPVKLKCQAEILSVEIDFGNSRKICISTCYRVGTLGDENHSEIEKISKKFGKN